MKSGFQTPENQISGMKHPHNPDVKIPKSRFQNSAIQISEFCNPDFRIPKPQQNGAFLTDFGFPQSRFQICEIHFLEYIGWEADRTVFPNIPFRNCQKRNPVSARRWFLISSFRSLSTSISVSIRPDDRLDYFLDEFYTFFVEREAGKPKNPRKK